MISAFLLLACALGSALSGQLPGANDANHAGFVSVRFGTVHLFYHLFESRNDPATDPVIVWFSGGPGCSSSLALFGENGPYSITDDLQLQNNPHSWSSVATVVWVDQPAGTGFSHGMLAPTEDIIAEDVWDMLQGIMSAFPQYVERDLYLFGESYAGHYVPVISHRVVEKNAKLAALAPWDRERQQHVHLNLVGAAIGNGLTHPLVQYLYYAPYAKEHGLVSKRTHAFMEAFLPLCEALTAGCDYLGKNGSDPATGKTAQWVACENAYIFCNYGQIAPVQSTGINLYDVRMQCDPAQPLCYDFSAIEKFLNLPEVQEALGTTGRKWATCNRMVDMTLVLAGDWMHRYDDHVAAVLDSGIKFLIYAGEADYICNWLGNRAWTKALKWRHTLKFNWARNTTWTVPIDGETAARGETVDAGSYVSAEGFTFLKVRDAGHMVPRDQPAASLQMVRDFFAGAFDGRARPGSHSAAALAEEEDGWDFGFEAVAGFGGHGGGGVAVNDGDNGGGISDGGVSRGAGSGSDVSDGVISDGISDGVSGGLGTIGLRGAAATASAPSEALVPSYMLDEY